MGQIRRRGTELEQAIYKSARTIIDKEGVNGLTFPKVAKVAKTSKSVIYRHWKSPVELAIAAMQDRVILENKGTTAELVLTGESIREDLFQVMRRFLVSIDTIGEMFLRSILTEISQEQSEGIHKTIAHGSAIDIQAIDRVLKRATDRGEPVKNDLTSAQKLLPFDWIRYHMFIQQKVDDTRLTTLIDEILLPLYLKN